MNILDKLLTLIESPSKVRYLEDQVQSLRQENRYLREQLNRQKEGVVKTYGAG